jgi:serine/threonine protein kinase
LDHRNVAKVFDFDEIELDDGASFFIALEYIDGVPLDEWARRLQQTATPDEYAARALNVIRQIAEGLVAAHACRYADDAGFQITGVMHGDIKPSNIIVRSNDVPVLLDFMLVDVQRHLRGGAPPRPLAGIPSTAAFGTPGFMAPEQEEKGIVTVATDIYGFGKTLWLTVPKVLVANARLGALATAMVAERPEARPGSMQAVLDALVAAIGDVPPTSTGLAHDDVTPLPGPRPKGFFRRLFG